MSHFKIITTAMLSVSLLMACSDASSPVAKAPVKSKTGETPAPGTNVPNTGTGDSKSGTPNVDPPSEVDKSGGKGGTTPTVDPKPDPMTEGPISETPAPNYVGGIDAENTYVRIGEITGYAVDKSNLKNFLTVNFYFDGDNKTGKKLGSIKANLYGSDDNNGGDHAFVFKVPTQFIDSKAHKLYAYVVFEDKEYPLSNKMPYTVSVYKPKGGAAQQLYNQIGFETKCGPCHSGAFDYQNRWSKLVDDGFNGKPWGESTNYLYEKVATSHRSISGGSVCSKINCEKLKEWWRAEFAP